MPDDAAIKPALSHADIVDRYDGRAPRYTSYPTALQFTAAVGEETYRAWLSAIPADGEVSLYVHIPFCARLCWYCGCNTRVVQRRDTINEYVVLLLKEARLLADTLPAGVTVTALHFGGGTPNMLDPEQLATLMGGLRAAFRFAPEFEIAAELDPAILTEAWVKAAASNGLRRASLGVQTLDAVIQNAINRRESYDHIAQCMGWLRDAGIRSVNVDLMYGLPHQTTEATLATVEQVLKLRPERIALFGYAHVPWMKPHQKLLPEDALPGALTRLDQSEAAADRLVEAGYVRIGMDHFALPGDDLAEAALSGRLRRNFQGYTADQSRTLLGLGASSIGALPQGYVQNAAQEVAWRDAVRSGHLPIVRGVALTDDDRLRAEIIERLMCDLRVDLAAVCASHGRTPADFDDAIASLQSFRDDGLLTYDGRVVQAREPGRIVLRGIAAAFDAHFAATGGHSKAL